MKVGGENKEADTLRVVRLQEELPEAIIRLDGNQGFTPKEAEDFLADLVKRGVRLEMVEQPVDKHDLTGLDYVARNSPVPILADEACVTPEDAYRICSTTAVHGVNVKLMKSGLSGALSIIRIAQAANRRLMIGCMIESPVGLSAALALACGTGAFDYVDLDGHVLIDIKEEITEFEAKGPFLTIRDL
jgi:L-alanine-DL-glutamate epimerase-like enolase superfamily enzyme